MSSLNQDVTISFAVPSSPTQAIEFSDIYESDDVPPSPKRRRREETSQAAEKFQRAIALPSYNRRNIGESACDNELSGNDLNGPKIPTITYDTYNSSSNAVNNIPDAAFSMFAESVLSEECSFWQLSRTLFIVNGWDSKKGSALPAWYHVHQVLTQTGKSIACFCPQSRKLGNCFHVRFLQQYGDERFPITMTMPADDNRTYLFSRYDTHSLDEENDIFHNIFSVPSGGATGTVKNRAVVDHYGDDTGSGKWSCSKDPRIYNCGHILLARKCLQQHIHQDLSVDDSNGKKGDIIFEDHGPMRKASHGGEAVSYLPRFPPIWGRIASDPLYPSIRNAEPIPERLYLGDNASCCCRPSIRTRQDVSNPIITIQCEIYGLFKMWTAHIEVQKCTTCKSRLIGPDCREIGLFNWNNRILLTHELLDDYTSAYCTSETPFVAWVTVVARRYESHGSTKAFISDKKFRCIWFAYAKLMELNGDMICPTCGPTPKVTIWDGVTLSFSRKHVLPTLQPPTKIDKRSPIRAHTKYPTATQYLPDKPLRKNLKQFLTRYNYSDRQLEPISCDGSELRRGPESFLSPTYASGLLANVIKGLLNLDAYWLSRLFERVYSIPGLREIGLKRPLEVYDRFFLQIAAEESALQLATRPTLSNLASFLSNPILDNISCLTSFPALYSILLHEFNSSACQISLPDDTLGVCKWLLLRGLTVLYSMLSTSELSHDDFCPEEDHRNWLQTGSCYSMPQIRHRPLYPKLLNDGKLDKVGKDGNGDGCQKYYATYGQHRLTGGLMMVWCTHSICYGFHCIPMTEGRNKVFSAIYTHWKIAPEIVIYNFACSLQPYCMAREPGFFADTSFLIDHFHSTGHTRCGKASFLSNYVETNPRLMDINSSAAECGNGGLRRIRKSVSYMSQEHAILYTKVYISYWNRSRIRKLAN